MEIQGKIINVLEERSGVAKGSGKPYRVAQYILETQDRYPRKLLFEVFGDDKINQMNIQVGEELTVSFDIDAREYNGRWYNTIRAFNVIRLENVATASARVEEPDSNPERMDDLPFGNGADTNEPPF